MSKKTATSLKQWVLGVSCVLVMLGATVASAGPFHGKHGMSNPLEKMLDHVDLSEEQEQDVQSILEALPEHPRKKGFGMMREMILLDPQQADYDEQVENHASQISERVKQHIKLLSKARKDIYAILTPEQRQDIEEAIVRKMERMDKRMAKHH